MRLRSGLLIGIFGLVVVLLGGWYFTLAIALLTYLALLEFLEWQNSLELNQPLKQHYFHV